MIWLARLNVDIASITLFASVSTPYALKFLWSPLIDGTRFPVLSRLLGRRRGWLLATQLFLIISISLVALSNPATHLWWTAMAALFLAFCSASQDIVIDAYRVDILAEEQQGAGAGMAVLGYRLGMIASGAGVLFIAKAHDWVFAYQCMAALMVVGIITTLLSPEPSDVAQDARAQQRSLMAWLEEYIVQPFANFMTRPHWLAVLFFIVLYKLSDAFMGAVTGTFFIKIGFDEGTIATVVKIYGVIATILGSLIGGWLVARIGLMRSLWICGIVQALTNLIFIVQAHLGAHTGFLAVAITLENISGGMGSAAFVAFISGLCNRHFTATQYALLSSLAAFGTTWLAMPSGWFVKHLGWEGFFFFATLLGIPSLILLYWLRKRVSWEKKA